MTKPTPQDRLGALRIIDANFDRAAEGLRVIEEYARFVLDDQSLTSELKRLRHRLTAALATIPDAELLAARNTGGDVGCTVTTQGEQQRENLAHVVRASFQRVEQALRSIEEYGKILDPELAREVESIRYDTYILEGLVLRQTPLRKRLNDSRLYVLLGGGTSDDDFLSKANALIAAKVDVIQLRGKALDDRTLLTRARLLRKATMPSETLFIMNDRPDLAVLSRADGVHVGQAELPVREIRKLVGPEMLIGVSTHTLEQAKQAVKEGANYLGCGPTFPSSTKSFESFPGVGFLKEVSAAIPIPAFAIGGIDATNLDQVIAAGFRRIAVSGAIAKAEDPAEAARALRARLEN